MLASLGERFWAKVEKQPNGCWLWMGIVRRDGYGTFWLARRRSVLAHRFAYGPVPPGLELDHLCRVKRCVNPVHLEAVSHQVNIARGRHFNGEKTICKHGHALEPGAIRTYPPARARPWGKRVCRTCSKARSAAFRLNSVLKTKEDFRGI